MASIPGAITTTAKVKAFMNITDTNSDAVIDDLVSAVTMYIQGYCGGRVFATTNYVEIKDTYNSNKLFMNQRPVQSVTVVEYRGGVPSSPTWNTYSNNGYVVYLGAGFIRFFTRFIPTPQAIRITYTAGYLINFAQENDPTQHTLPFELTQVATEMCAEILNKRYSQGMVKEATEGQSVQFETENYALINNHKEVLKGYMMNRVAP